MNGGRAAQRLLLVALLAIFLAGDVVLPAGHHARHACDPDHDAAHCALCQIALAPALAAAPVALRHPIGAVALPEAQVSRPPLPTLKHALPFACGSPSLS